jgi:hypothetical protein
MAVSKRTRYEVLRRDNHACRYCGAAAPHATLTVDHVTPVALGGGDDPSNLVAACRDCNAGKSSTSPDAGTVAQVNDDAVRWTKAIKAAAATEVRSIRKARKYAAEVYQAWETYMPNYAKMPDDWEQSVTAWRSMGLPVEVVTDAVYKAACSQAPNGAKFRYMAKVCWNRLTEIQDQAKRQLGVPQASPTVTCDHGCRSEDGACDYDEDSACPHCGVVGCPYVHGFETAGQQAWSAAWDRFAYRDVPQRALEDFVDRRPAPAWAA